MPLKLAYSYWMPSPVIYLPAGPMSPPRPLDAIDFETFIAIGLILVGLVICFIAINR